MCTSPTAFAALHSRRSYLHAKPQPIAARALKSHMHPAPLGSSFQTIAHGQALLTIAQCDLTPLPRRKVGQEGIVFLRNLLALTEFGRVVGGDFVGTEFANSWH